MSVDKICVQLPYKAQKKIHKIIWMSYSSFTYHILGTPQYIHKIPSGFKYSIKENL